MGQSEEAEMEEELDLVGLYFQEWKSRVSRIMINYNIPGKVLNYMLPNLNQSLSARDQENVRNERSLLSLLQMLLVSICFSCFFWLRVLKYAPQGHYIFLPFHTFNQKYLIYSLLPSSWTWSKLPSSTDSRATQPCFYPFLKQAILFCKQYSSPLM